MDITEVLSLDLELELPEGLDKGHAFYIPHGATELQEEVIAEAQLQPVSGGLVCYQLLCHLASVTRESTLWPPHPCEPSTNNS